jgi:hypothetical protein
MKVSIEQAVTNVNECMSSIFTKNDVLNLLQSIEMKKENLVTKEMLVTFVTDYVEKQVEQLETQDILDLSSAEFCLSGNEIELDNVEIDISDLTRNILGEIDEAVDTFLNYDL